jgi:hypothetical protein
MAPVPKFDHAPSMSYSLIVVMIVCMLFGVVGFFAAAQL